MSKVSIVIPIYNAERFLRETLDSILKQTETDWKCIMVNDGSTDDSESIMMDFEKKDERFSLVRINNSGCADIPIAKGMDLVNTDLCCFMGHDDVLEKGFIEKLLRRQIETDADIVCPRMIGSISGLEGELYRLPSNSFNMDQILTGEQGLSLTLGDWDLTANGMLYRTSLNAGIIRGHYMNSDEFSSRQILSRAKKIAFADAHYFYRNHNESISRKVSPRLWERATVDKQIEDFVFQNYSNSSMEQSIVQARFLNLVHLTYDAFAKTNHFSRECRKVIICGVRFAFYSLEPNRIMDYMPKHYRLFMGKGFVWFAMVSLIYVTIKTVQGKEYWYK